MWTPFHSSSTSSAHSNHAHHPHFASPLEINEEEEFARVWDPEDIEQSDEIASLRSFIVHHPLAVVAAVSVGVTTLLMMRRRRSSPRKQARPRTQRTASPLSAAVKAAVTAALMAAGRQLAYRAVAEANERWLKPA